MLTRKRLLEIGKLRKIIPKDTVSEKWSQIFVSGGDDIAKMRGICGQLLDGVRDRMPLLLEENNVIPEHTESLTTVVLRFNLMAPRSLAVVNKYKLSRW